MPDQPASSAGYVITEEGHVHDADGNHIGAYDENTGLVITDDGHVHTVDGAHVGEGVLEINKPLGVSAYGGTIGSVVVKVGQEVK